MTTNGTSTPGQLRAWPPHAHVFADESKARGFLMAAAVVAEQDVETVARQIRALHLAGQSRLHYATEGPARRRLILSALCAMPTSVRIYDATAIDNERDARCACLAQLVADAASSAARVLVLEQDDSLIDSDRRQLYALVRKHGCLETLRYEHRQARQVPLLAIADAAAWCWARGGEWKRRSAPLISELIRL